MGRPPAKDGQDAGSLRPIDELLKESKYPNLIEEYHQIAEKDLYLVELYRLAATQSEGFNNIISSIRRIFCDIVR
jgi:hypothetical protein